MGVRSCTSDTLGFISAAVLGATVMYVFDPVRGARRRALARDKAVLAMHEIKDAFDVTARDLANRTRGVFAESVAVIRRREVPDAVVLERVRAKLGRVSSHPSAIEVSVAEGAVTLSGPILEAELDQTVGAIEGVRGVRRVENHLQAHRDAEGVPGLQGGTRRPGERFELMQENWAPATRFLVGLTGAMLTGYGLERRNIPGAVVGTAGAALLTRAAANRPARRLVNLAAGRSEGSPQRAGREPIAGSA